MAPTTKTKVRSLAPSQKVFKALYLQLNLEQQQAVDSIDGTVMVLAGPGTGKTQLLTMRIANILINTQMKPDNILCLTFTKSGVAAMRQRLLDIIGAPAYQVNIHTFHSFCHEVISQWPDKFNIARVSDSATEANDELVQLTDLERVKIFKTLLANLSGTSPLKPFGNTELFLPSITTAISKLKQEHITPEKFQKIINLTAKLVTSLEPAINDFISLPAKERTDRNCQQIIKTVDNLKSQFIALHFHFNFFSKLAKEFEATLELAANKRAVQTSRTQFKNSVKRWFNSIASPLLKQRELNKVYRRYQRELSNRQLYDFEDMIIFVLERWQQDDKLLAYYQEQYQYILVDEYQDTNGAQNEILFTLGEFQEAPNLFVVGDDQQSIYRFQGAAVENLVNFYERYQSDISVISLRRNYRSTATILAAAYHLISHNDDTLRQYLPRLSRQLKSVSNQYTNPIIINNYATPEDEQAGVARQIELLLKQGVKPQEIAILTRRNDGARQFANILKQKNIPVNLATSTDILSLPAVNQLLDLLHFLDGNTNSQLLWRLLHFNFFELDPLDIMKSHFYAQHHQLTLPIVLSSPKHLNSAQVTDPQALLNTIRNLSKWTALSANQPLQNFLSNLLEQSNFWHHYIEESSLSDIVPHIQILFSEAKQLNELNHNAKLKEYLKHLNLLRQYNLELTVDPSATAGDGVAVMTAHKAKGLEFSHVFIPYVADHKWGNLRPRSPNLLPHGLLKHETVSLSAAQEDERRLFFVCLTRAKETITLSYANTNDSGRPQIASSFLAELSPQNTKPITISPRKISSTRVPVQLQPRPEVGSRELQAYLRKLLETHTLSVTHLNNYLRCPRLFYYRNLLRLPAAKNKHMAFGTAIHGALYDFFSSIKEDKRPSSKFLIGQFEHHLKRQILTDQERSDSLTLGRRALQIYYQKYISSFTANTLLEYNFASHQIHLLNDIPLTGKIDKIELLSKINTSQSGLLHPWPEGVEVSVVDYKTGNPDGKSAQLKVGGDYHRQLVFYRLLCNLSNKFPYVMSRGIIDFIEPSKRTGHHLKRQYTINEADIGELTEIIKRVWQEIKNLDFLTGKTTPFCGICQYCKS